MDAAIVEHLVADFRAAQGIDLSQDHLALQRLHEAAETAKLELSSAHQTAVALPFITADASGPRHLDATLTRARFGALIEPILEQTAPACASVQTKSCCFSNGGVSKSSQ